MVVPVLGSGSDHVPDAPAHRGPLKPRNPLSRRTPVFCARPRLSTAENDSTLRLRAILLGDESPLRVLSRHWASNEYPPGMKTAGSIPNEIFASADALARQLGVSRSVLYARAVAEHVARHQGADVTT